MAGEVIRAWVVVIHRGCGRCGHRWHSLRMDIGVYSLEELNERGVDRRELGVLLDQGGLRRLRKGWFATPRASPAVTKAVSMGGTLGCLSGCSEHGIWTPNPVGLHVMLNPGVPVPRANGAELHRLKEPSRLPLAPVKTCLQQCISRHSPETGLIVVESALNLGLIREADARELIAAAPVAKRGGLAHFMPGAGSGSETRVRYFLQQRRFRVRPQVFIAGVGRVDLLVGRSLIIECDSQRHHSSPDRYRVDRSRDLSSRDLGYSTMRLSYDQIWYQWERTQRSLLAELSTGNHRRAPIPRNLMHGWR